MFIGNKIPTNEPAWELFCVLLSIVEYLTAKVLRRGHVEEFIEGRISIFPNDALKPKEHFMLHYCDQILKFGPLVHLWTIRFEAKHQQFVNIFKPIKCSKNVT